MLHNASVDRRRRRLETIAKRDKVRGIAIFQCKWSKQNLDVGLRVLFVLRVHGESRAGQQLLRGLTGLVGEVVEMLHNASADRRRRRLKTRAKRDKVRGIA